MTNKEYRLASMKHTLLAKRKAGQKEVIWKLNDEQLNYISSIAKDIFPYLYEINTRTFCSTDKIASSLIKEIHFARKNGKKKLYKKLKRNELKELKQYGVEYRCLKYRIIL